MTATTDGEIAALAKGGRTNFLGFLLRLAARLPFLFIAGRLYGADALGRWAYHCHLLYHMESGMMREVQVRE